MATESSGKKPKKMCTTPTSPWLDVKEAAAYLQITPRTLLYLVRMGRIKGYPLMGTRRRVWRFRLDDLDASLIEQ